MNLTERVRGKFYFALSLPHEVSADLLEIITSGGHGDSDLYVHFDAIPTTLVYTNRSVLSSNTEKISIIQPQNGKAFINNFLLL